jgi:hypothetical protein
MMSGMEATVVMIALFVLRFAIPVVITIGATAAMNRLLEHWQVVG